MRYMGGGRGVRDHQVGGAIELMPQQQVLGVTIRNENTL